MTIRHILKHNALAEIGVGTSIGEAIDRMNQVNDGIIFVVDAEKKLMGIITAGDMGRAISHVDSIKSLKIAEIMTRHPRCASTDTEVTSAFEIIKEHSINALPVVDPAGRLEGYVTLHDVISALTPEKIYESSLDRVFPAEKRHLSYQQTLIKNLKRVEKLVDDNVQLTEDGVPLFSWLDISPIDMCNRACVFCPRSDPQVTPNQNLFMPRRLYTKIADELGELKYNGSINIAGYGEPMLYKDIYGMIETFSKVSHVEITTNGDPLNPNRIEKLLKAGVNKIVISLYDGPEQIEKFESMFREVGAPSELYILRDRWYGEEDNFGIKLTNRGGTVKIGKQEAVDTNKKCYYTHYSMSIDWNGDVFLCIQDWNRKIRSGNLMLSTMMEVWTSNILRRYRLHLSAGRRDMLPCVGCNAEGTLHGWNHARIWDARYAKAASGDD